MTQRAPDPWRPGHVPAGRPLGKLGRAGFAAAVFGAVVVALLGFLLALR